MHLCLIPRFEIPASPAADVHPGHLDVPECPQDEYSHPPRAAGRLLRFPVADCRRLSAPGKPTI